MSVDDIFDSVQAPSWAESLQEKNADWEEADDSFFPEVAAMEEVVVQIEQMSVTEDAEDLSRMAMFGNKPQIKRRSQIRREQEAAIQKKPEAPSAPAAIPKRPTSIPRAPSIPRTNVASAPRQPLPVANRTAGPVTRSQTRAAAGTPQISTERRSRDMNRNSTTVRRSVQPSPVPNQQEFNRAVSSRASSLGKEKKIPQPTPTRRIAVPTRTVPTVPPTKPATPTVSSSQVGRSRVAVPVANSPRPTHAFGSAVRNPAVSRVPTAPSQRSSATPKPPVVARPPIQRSTPARPLTQPRTPLVVKRSSSITRPAQQQPATPKTERKVLKPKDIQGMVDRLSKPKSVISRPVPPPIEKRIVPNTYTHGLQSSVKIRSRSHSRASSRNGAAPNENVH